MEIRMRKRVRSADVKCVWEVSYSLLVVGLETHCVFIHPFGTVILYQICGIYWKMATLGMTTFLSGVCLCVCVVYSDSVQSECVYNRPLYSTDNIRSSVVIARSYYRFRNSQVATLCTIILCKEAHKRLEK